MPGPITWWRWIVVVRRDIPAGSYALVCVLAALTSVVDGVAYSLPLLLAAVTAAAGAVLIGARRARRAGRI